jgi:cell division protein FtsB
VTVRAGSGARSATLPRTAAGASGVTPRVRPRSVGDTIRDTRAQRVASATQGLLGVSSTRRAAVLAVVVCALALTVAVPLRNFLTQRAELAQLQQRQLQQARQLGALSDRLTQLRDPAYVQAQARERLGYVPAGEIPFVVQLPGEGSAPEVGPGPGGPSPWFDKLWSDVRGVPR